MALRMKLKGGGAVSVEASSLHKAPYKPVYTLHRLSSGLDLYPQDYARLRAY